YFSHFCAKLAQKRGFQALNLIIFAFLRNPLKFAALVAPDNGNAATQIACEPPPPIDLLVLESPVTLRTQDYHRLPRQQKLIAS
ncbi:hypothetical protein MJM28_31490, partial [Salmonella enterica subsp. enterica serovar Montevideo]|nr:hypothetical protein [Salmonella enterica subsp. enterica serovar Montevideo]